MPTIEITQQQQDTLDAGHAITVMPPEKSYLVTMFETFNVFRVTTTKAVVVGEPTNQTIYGKCVLVAKGAHTGPVGFQQSCITGDCVAVLIENPADFGALAGL